MAMGCDEAEAAWREARTLRDLGELTASYLLGGLNYHPCYGGPPDQETAAISGVLAECNRHGFVTDFSQPGVPLDEQGCGQRAAVTGYAVEVTAMQVAALTVHTDLVVLAFPPGVDRGCQIPVTVSEFYPSCWIGASSGLEELECFAQACQGAALSALGQAWYVCAFDPQWGREAYLWDHLVRALREPQVTNGRFTAAPSPDLDLDVDFVW